MITHADKTQENKSQTVSNALPQKRSGSVSTITFVDNRSEAAIQRKLQEIANNRPKFNRSPELKKATYHAQTPIIQRVVSFNDLVTAVQTNNEALFKTKFRAMDDGKDELISCEATFAKARQYYLAGNNAAMLDIIKTSHGIRLDTGYVAHHVKTAGAGKKTCMGFHPTGQNDNLLKGPKNLKGNRKWVGHTSWNKRRAKKVTSEKNKQAMIDRAIEETLNRFSQPPFANNTAVAINDIKRKKDWHKKRELLKKRHSQYNPSKTQKKDAPWTPGAIKNGGVSPSRPEN